MIDKKEFENIGKDLKHSDEKREEVIQKSRIIIRLSKKIIYALHRNDLEQTEKLVNEIKDSIKDLPQDHHGTDINIVARQEYVEALCYYLFIKEKRMPLREELDVDTESYLLGICDFSGELVRKAVALAIDNKFDDVLKIKELVETIYCEFLEFDLRNSELRRKSDQIKWNLNKLEDMVYEIKLRGK